MTCANTENTQTSVDVEEDNGSNWLLEKARNKEYGEWMVVERR